jgi:glucose/arabinose dehydrogenase
MRRDGLATTLGLVLAVALCALGWDSPGAAAPPALQVTTVVGGLDIPWDVQRLPDGRLLITERDTRRLLLFDGRLHRVRFPRRSVWSHSETGLLSLAVDPQFTANHRFYTCAGGYTRHGHDAKVRVWQLKTRPLRVRLRKTLVSGLPQTTGRHSGCRLLILSDGSLLVGTGDAATGTNPRDLGSLGGKTLRINRSTGAPWPGNPFRSASNPRTRLIWTYGHRNVQGLAERADGTLWSVEHGPDRDDEVNLLQPGGDYGWNPVPGYNESVPMTDESLPGEQVPARWSSGFPTLATSGATFVSGAEWGPLDGTLAVAALKGSRLLFLHFDSSGTWQSTDTPPELLGTYGRLRSVTRMPDGSLLVTTANGNRTDRVLQVRPAG